ncbi:MAG: hypothetical protein ACLTKG_01730 [Collinsella intestinalis]
MMVGHHVNLRSRSSPPPGKTVFEIRDLHVNDGAASRPSKASTSRSAPARSSASQASMATAKRSSSRPSPA